MNKMGPNLKEKFDLGTTPTLKDWYIDEDGSITGKINNSEYFEEGEEIRTAPIQARSDAGNVVTTVSGSSYRLVGPERVPPITGSVDFKGGSPFAFAPGFELGTLFGSASNEASSSTKTNFLQDVQSKLKDPLASFMRAGSNIATLTQWEQKPDGSIEGLVTGSDRFEDGTFVVTSPVNEIAESGQTVTTVRGSQYKLS